MARSLVEDLLHDFWMLTLCTEQAIEDEDWEAVSSLLQRREEVLAALERLRPEPQWIPLLRRAQEADARCQELLHQKQRTLLLELEQETQQQRGCDHYEAPSSDYPARFDAEG